MKERSGVSMPDLYAGDAGDEERNVLAAAQLIYAEKRTALALLRTGISVFALPLAVLSALIATSKYYNADDIPHLFIPVMVLNGALVLLGGFLVIRSLFKIRHEDCLLKKIKTSHPDLAAYFD